MIDKLTQQHIDDAIKWYQHNDIIVVKVDFGTYAVGGLAVVPNEDQHFQLELSADEIMCRADLWNEMKENLEGENND